MSIYKDSIKDLELAILKYKNGLISIDGFKSIVWQTSQHIVSIEEVTLRDFLKQIEAELDSIQFTVDDEKIFDEVLKVIIKLEAFLSNNHSS